MAPTPHEQFLKCKYFDALDGLRAFSILAVIWHHSVSHTGGVLSRGYLGVHLFFAISGILITTLLVREHAKSGTIWLRGFYVRRILRIFPLYYAVLGIYVVVVTLIERDKHIASQFYAHVVYFLTYTSNWFVDLDSGNRVIFYFAWSLAAEEQFYLIWPAAVRLTKATLGAGLVMITLLAAGQAALFLSAGVARSDQTLAIRIFASVQPPICLGCLAALALHRRRGFAWLYLVAGARWSAPLGVLLVLLCVAMEGVPILLTSAAMVYLVTACVIRPDHLLRKVLENGVARHIGTISYGMYLLHMLSVNLVRRILGSNHGGALSFLGATLVSIALASISHRYFEARFLRLKDRFAGSNRGLAAQGSRRPTPGAAGA